MKFQDITGMKFYRLTAIQRVQGKYWVFHCDCGKRTTCKSNDVKAGKTKSCGCYRKETMITHGRSKSKAYMAWYSMLERCNNSKVKKYKNYGGRGIKVCSRWSSFNNFLSDMGERPANLSLDRIDNDGNYSPSNCRWATTGEQNRNKRNSINVDVGQGKINLKDLSYQTGIHYDTLYCRYKSGITGKELIREVGKYAR